MQTEEQEQDLPPKPVQKKRKEKKKKSRDLEGGDEIGTADVEIAQFERQVEPFEQVNNAIPVASSSVGSSDPDRPRLLQIVHPLITALTSSNRHENLVALQELSELLVVANEEDFIRSSNPLATPSLVPVLLGFLQPKEGFQSF